MHFENGYVTGNGPYIVDEGNQDDGRTTFTVTIPADAAFGIVSIEAHLLDSFPFSDGNPNYEAFGNDCDSYTITAQSYIATVAESIDDGIGSGADVSGTNLERASLEGTHQYDNETQLPAGFDAVAAGVLLLDQGHDGPGDL